MLGGLMLLFGALFLTAGVAAALSMGSNPTWSGVWPVLGIAVLGIATLTGSAWLFQWAASGELLSMTGTQCFYSRKRWWRWRDQQIDPSELEVAASPACLKDVHDLIVVTVRREGRVLFILAADDAKNAEQVAKYGITLAAVAELPWCVDEKRVSISGDIRLFG
ncbi:MAG: hypothetical protein RIB60_10370 [Phycisphaerales bacterium]